MRIFQVLIIFLLVIVPLAAALADEVPVLPSVTADAINAADLGTIPADYLPPPAGDTTGSGAPTIPATPNAAISKLQILLDRAGTSPGVIDGLDGDNVRKAIIAFENMAGLTVDGRIGPAVIDKLQTDGPVVGATSSRLTT